MRNPARQLHTIYLVMFALLFNAMTSSAMASSLGENGMLLCTSQGYKWVNVEQDGKTVEQAQEHCQACLFPHNDDSPSDLINSASANTFSKLASNDLLLASDIALLQRDNFALHLSRAPPVFSH